MEKEYQELFSISTRFINYKKLFRNKVGNDVGNFVGNYVRNDVGNCVINYIVFYPNFRRSTKKTFLFYFVTCKLISKYR